MTMLQQLASRWRERQTACGYKGKKANDAVLEYFIGATVALQLAKHPEADHVGTCSSLILATAPFPLSYVEKWARGDDWAKAADTKPATECGK